MSDTVCADGGGGGRGIFGRCRLLRLAGTVCGRARMPAPLSTLLTLQTPATPRCASPHPSAALYARIISQQKKKKKKGDDAGGPVLGKAQLPLHPLCPASPCASTLAAFTLSLFSRWRGDTKRHPLGRDKPILEMLGGPDANPPFLPFFTPSSPLLPGEACCARFQAPLERQWCMYSCVFVFARACACVSRVGSKDNPPSHHHHHHGSPVTQIHGKREAAGRTSRDIFQNSLQISV